jgi:hypothetical protein
MLLSRAYRKDPKTKNNPKQKRAWSADFST